MQPLAFVDIETTGSNFERDRITEVAIATLQGNQTEYWETLLNPEILIPTFIQSLTGISSQMVQNKPLFSEIGPEIYRHLDQKIFVAHNARFDYGFLKAAFQNIGLNFKPKVVCTVKLSRLLFPQEKKHNLDSILERYSIVNTARHRAMGDAKAILQFWQHCEKEFGAQRILEAVQTLLGKQSLPPHIDGKIIEAIPDTPGVYLFFGENKECLYIGKSKNIKTRVLSHFQSSLKQRKEAKLSLQIREIDWIETSGELGALLLESELIKKRLPLMNIRLRKTSSMHAWQLTPSPSGYLIPTLISKRDLEPGLQENLYGLFKSRRDALNYMRGITEKYCLCEAVMGLESTKPGQSCFAFQLKKCSGDCVGQGNQQLHNLKLTTALENLRLQKWPYRAAVAIKEGEVCHVFDQWCYLGASKTLDDTEDLVKNATPEFDQDIYKIAKKHLSSVAKQQVFELDLPRKY